MQLRQSQVHPARRPCLRSGGRIGWPDPQTDEVLAIEQFQSVHGLPGYLPATMWQRFSGNGTPMELSNRRNFTPSELAAIQVIGALLLNSDRSISHFDD
jgi:hypothetical protein